MSKKNYLFHFIISGLIDNNIKYLKEKLNFNKNSRLFDYLLDLLTKNYSNIKRIIGNHKSEYAIIDINDTSRIDKYLRLNQKKYKLLKKWHYLFNEYSISAILRDIINFFYEGIIKYGVEKFINMVSKKINIGKIRNDITVNLTHMIGISIKKHALFSFILENLPTYV